MRKYFRKIWVRFLIHQLKKGGLKNESIMRIMIHFTLLDMQERKIETLEMEYSAPEVTKTKLLLIAYLTEK